MEKPSSFGQIVSRVDWVDAHGNQHSTTETKRFIGSNGLFGIVTQMTMKVAGLQWLLAEIKVHSLCQCVSDNGKMLRQQVCPVGSIAYLLET